MRDRLHFSLIHISYAPRINSTTQFRNAGAQCMFQYVYVYVLSPQLVSAASKVQNTRCRQIVEHVAKWFLHDMFWYIFHLNS